MDPTNNPVPNQTPNLGAEPMGAPATGPVQPTAPVAPVTPPAPVAPATPAAPVAPAAQVAPAAPAAPAAPVVPPVINPPVSGFQPGGGAIDTILRPEPAPTPDPIEEELKAPMRAAEPAPGSIGSAVSGPVGDIASAVNNSAPMGGGNMAMGSNPQTPSVSFNDPATTPDAAAQPNMMAGKKSKNKTLIILIVVAAMVVIALVGVLVMQFLTVPGDSTSQTPNNPVVIQPDTGTDNGEMTTAASTLSCTRNMTNAELVDINDAVSGNINISAEFADGQLTSVALARSVFYSDEDIANNEPTELAVEQAEAADLTATSALNYYLPVDSDGKVDLTLSGIQSHYESLDFVCQAL